MTVIGPLAGCARQDVSSGANSSTHQTRRKVAILSQSFEEQSRCLWPNGAPQHPQTARRSHLECIGAYRDRTAFGVGGGP